MDIKALQADNTRLQAALKQKEQEVAELKAQLEHVQPGKGRLPHLKNTGDLDELLFLAQAFFTAVFLIDARGTITWVNQGFTQLCGYEPYEVIGRPAWQVLAYKVADAETTAHITACWEKRLPLRFDAPHPCSDNETSWIRVKAQPVFGPDEQLAFYAGTIEDLSEWKKSQRNLVHSEKRYRELIENAPSVLFEWQENFDDTSECLYASPKLQDIFGIDPAQASSIVSFVHPDDQPGFAASVLEAKRRCSSWHFEGRFVVKDEPLRWFRGDSVYAGKTERGMIFQGVLHDITATRVAEETVRESGQRWRMAMEGVGNDTWEYDLETRNLSLSPRYKKLFGHQGEILELDGDGHYLYPNVYREDAAAAAQTFRAYLRGELPIYSATYRLRDPSGEDRWIMARAMVTKRDEQGNPRLVTGTHTDVTEVTQAKLAQEASALRLASTIANLQRAVLLEDENHKIILLNDSFCRMFKLPFSPDQLTGADSARLLEHMKTSFPDPESFVSNVAAIQEQQRVVRREVLVLKDGILLERDSSPIHANGKHLGYLWKYDDVTQRKKDEEALKRREEKYRSILENLNLGLVEVDLDGQVMFVNDSYCEITGYSKDELLHNNLDALNVSDSGRVLMLQKRKALAEGISDTYEMAMRTKRGELKWLLISSAPLYNDEKQLIGSIGVHLDISHQKQLEVKLRAAKQHAEESSRAKELFLANMSHEMRTPMNAIVGMGQLLGKTPLGTQQRNYLHAISSSAENLLVIINDILDLSKIEAGKMNIESIGFSLRKVCEQVEKTLRYKAEDKGLQLLVQVSPDIPDVLLGDPHRITQVLLNLASNSVKFTMKGEVSVTCELAGTLGHEVVVEFTVRDTGIGIDPKYLKDLFSDFSQEDPSVSRKFGGTGLA